MTIPRLPDEGFLEFLVDRRTQTVVARGEGLNPRVWIGFLIGLLFIIPTSVFVFGAFYALAAGEENYLVSFAALIFAALLSSFFVVSWAKPAFQAAFNTIELIIYKDDLTVAYKGPFSPPTETFSLNKILKMRIGGFLNPSIWVFQPTYDFKLAHRMLPEKLVCGHPAFNYHVALVSGRNRPDTLWIMNWIALNIDAIREDRDIGFTADDCQKANGPKSPMEEVFV